MWFDIIKMPPNPYLSESGKKQTWKFLTREQYYEMNNKNKANYHRAMRKVYQKQLNRLRGGNQPFDAPTETLNNEALAVQKLRNFHGNQINRIVANQEGASRPEPVFSIEEDKNPPTHRLQTTPMGNLQYGEWDMTKEEYDDAPRKEKILYHERQRAHNPNSHKSVAHSRERKRMKNHPNYTAPYNPEDAKSKEELYHSPTPSKEEYENMSNDDKRRFHGKMRDRYYRKGGEKDLSNFHDRMRGRLKRNSQLPTYYSIEEERNA